MQLSAEQMKSLEDELRKLAGRETEIGVFALYRFLRASQRREEITTEGAEALAHVTACIKDLPLESRHLYLPPGDPLLPIEADWQGRMPTEMFLLDRDRRELFVAALIAHIFAQRNGREVDHLLLMSAHYSVEGWLDAKTDEERAAVNKRHQFHPQEAMDQWRTLLNEFAPVVLWWTKECFERGELYGY